MNNSGKGKAGASQETEDKDSAVLPTGEGVLIIDEVKVMYLFTFGVLHLKLR